MAESARLILMTALTTGIALLPLAAFSGDIISAELATVVIGGLIISTALTLIVVPIVYFPFNVSIPSPFRKEAEVGPSLSLPISGRQPEAS